MRLVHTFFLESIDDSGVLHNRLEGSKCSVAKRFDCGRSWGRKYSAHIAGSVTFAKGGIYLHVGVAC